jgi:purine-cytosine permease-like protein
MSKLGQFLKHELHELIPVTVFFFATFELLALTEELMVKQCGISVSTFLGALVLALVVAKVVVITDHFAVVNRFPDKPLSYNVVWKTGIYFAALFAFRYAEHLFHFWCQTRNVAEANRRMIEEIVWPHFWAVQLWSVVLLLVYCAFRELVRALGRERVIKMFFKSPPPKDHEE